MDIVDRLQAPSMTHKEAFAAMSEAAAEITRLRKERDEAAEAVKTQNGVLLSALNARIAAERERDEARAALTSVRDAIVRADPDVLTCTLWMPDSMAETVVDFIDAALPTPEATK
jgi:vacuolar-type H+-ATPase subunit I/STV1